MQKRNKALTFSYDDGVVQDRRLVALFNQYGVKATFNLNSGLMDTHKHFVRPDGSLFPRVTIQTSEVRDLYKGHEVASHSIHHPMIPPLSEEEMIHEVEDDRKFWSEVLGYEVAGFAFTGNGKGDPSYDERAVDIIRKNTGVKYARVTGSSLNFDLPSDLLTFRASVWHHRWDDAFRLAEEFVALETDKPQVFCIAGHSYEFDGQNSWDKMEKLLQILSGKDDIFYGTCRQILLEDWG